jgi:hypothetical protein
MTTDSSKRKTIKIRLDREQFDVSGGTISGAEVRALPEPDVPTDRAIWKVVPGPEDDIPVEDADRVEIKNGDRFFTAPRVIAPGAADAPR